MKNLNFIVKLSDIPFVQERWEPKEGDWVQDSRRDGEIYCLDGYYWDYEGSENEEESLKDGLIFLPLGYNPETGNYQLDDLLMEAGGFDVWLAQRTYVSQDRRYDNPIIAKLTWLNELKGGKG